MRCTPLAFLVLIAATSPLQAQNVRRHECAEIVEQYSLTMCFRRVATGVDARLDTLLAQLRIVLPSAAFDSLQVVQEQWRNYSRAHCVWEPSFYDGGTIAPMIEWGCISNLTAERIGQLKHFLCEGHGMTGPCRESRRYDALPRP